MSRNFNGWGNPLRNATQRRQGGGFPNPFRAWGEEAVRFGTDSEARNALQFPVAFGKRTGSTHTAGSKQSNER